MIFPPMKSERKVGKPGAPAVPEAGAREDPEGPAEDLVGEGRGSGTLWLVPTPIGNYDDLSPRAAAVLAAAEVVAAEDTRVTGRLLRHLGLSKPLLSYHEHNERSRARQLVARLKAGARVALVSDAGTPLLSDPGYQLVRGAVDEGVRVVSLPGPCAAVAALAGSGLATHQFLFSGFLPRQAAAREAALVPLRSLPATLLFYEAPHRLLATVASLRAVLGDREAVAAWNLSKSRERFIRGTLSQLAAEFGAWEYVHGEVTLVVAGAAETRGGEAADPARVERAIQTLLDRGMGTGQIRDLLADLLGRARSQLYAQVLAVRRGGAGEQGAEGGE